MNYLMENSLLNREVMSFLCLAAFLMVAMFFLYHVINYFRPLNNFKHLKDSTISWMVMFVLLVLAVFMNKFLATLAFACCSIIAFRELSSAIQLQSSDRGLFKLCYGAIVVQYILAFTATYELFLVFIPVFVFMLLPIRAVITGETQGITKTLAIMQWIMMLTVFSLSHLAFLVNHDWSGALEQREFSAGSGGLILFLIFQTQINDIAQYFCGKLFGVNKIVPKVSPNKTWEGFIGGVLISVLVGLCSRFLTPFTVFEVVVVSGVISVVGFFGDVVVSAIKRDYGLKDLGNIIPGHGGIMDRLDSLAFTSLAFFYGLYFLL